MKNRGRLNLNYVDGFKEELSTFKEFKDTFTYILNANSLKPLFGTELDLKTGIDALAEIEKHLYGISLRVRNKDYNSFTLNRHITDPFSEIHKWTLNRGNKLKPSYHIQLARIPGTNKVNTFRLNIDVIGLHLNYLINTNQLEQYFKPHLLAYEFSPGDLKQFDIQFYNEIIDIQ